MKKLLLVLLATATALAIAPSALADNIPMGTATLGAQVGSTTGTLTGSSGFIADYTETVFDWSGGLAFKYDVTNTAPSADTIATMSSSYSGWANSALMLDYLSGDPVSGTYLTNSAGTVTIDFAGGGLGDAGVGASGNTSSDFILYTNAIAFGTGAINFIDSSTANGMALVPTPEPGTLLLLGSGLLGLALLVFYRKEKSAPRMMMNI